MNLNCAYLETANYIREYIKNHCERGELSSVENLFFPMCYLYRNCIELSLKSIWFEETSEEFQKKCKVMLDRKHSIRGMWDEIRPYAEKCRGDKVF